MAHKCWCSRVTLIVALPLILTSLRIISSQILHFLPSWMAGWNNQCHPENKKNPLEKILYLIKGGLISNRREALSAEILGKALREL